MTYISKPQTSHPSQTKNAIGLTCRDYEGAVSTLCSGCGHDAITTSIVQAFWDLSIPPHRVAKLSGLGCSSKTPSYFLKDAHGLDGVHGGMASLATGANAANRDLVYIGISGDGDSLAIGLGHLLHAIRRNVNLLYVLENNGVHALTKGQLSPSADRASFDKRGQTSTMEPIDGCLMALTLGATFVARSFSGDAAQLVPILKTGLTHRGFAFVDVISPCVVYNDHSGSTKSYGYTSEHNVEAIQTDFVIPADALRTDYDQHDAVRSLAMHDGSQVRLRKVAADYDPSDRDSAFAYVRERQQAGEVVTGLLYLSTEDKDMHEQLNTVAVPLKDLPFAQLCPGTTQLDTLLKPYS